MLHSLSRGSFDRQIDLLMDYNSITGRTRYIDGGFIPVT